MIHRTAPAACAAVAITGLLLVCPGVAQADLRLPNSTTVAALDSVAVDTLIAAVKKRDKTNNTYVFSLGYSFGTTNSPLRAETPTGSSGSERDNAPLLALSAEFNRYHRFGGSLKFALANFGRLTQFTMTDPNDSSKTIQSPEGTVRRSIIAEVDVHTRFGYADRSSILLLVNSGFIFDAETNEDEGHVEDASSYFFLGAAAETSFGDGSRLRVDALIGQSEVMNDIELFTREWRRKDVLRFRPKVRFLLRDALFESNPVIIGMWGDLGISDNFGDTYVVFVSRIFGTSGP